MGQENEQAKRALAFKDFQVNNDLMQQANGGVKFYAEAMDSLAKQVK
jgi:ornithine carbamoyltransferase